MSLLDESPPAGRPTHVRHLVVAIATLMAVLLYLDRICVAVAVDYIREDLRLTQAEIGWFLSAFFWSYALAQVPAGWFSDRYGARVMLVIYILSWSFFTAMIGAVSSLAMLLVARLGCGLGQAGAYPTSASVVSKWVPFTNRGTASAIISLGGRAGGAIAPLLTAWLIVQFVPADAPVTLDESDMLHGSRLAAKLVPSPESQTSPENVEKPSLAGLRIWELWPTDAQDVARKVAADYRQQESKELPTLAAAEETELRAALNVIITQKDIYAEEAFRYANLNRETLTLIAQRKSAEGLTDGQRQRLNRFLIEAAFSQEIGKLYAPGWRPVMIVYGAAGLVVAGLVWFFLRNRPEHHPWCNAAECEMIAASRPPGTPSPHGKAGRVPLKRLMLNRSMWLMCAVELATNVGWVFLISWFPRYLIDQHDVPILERGVMASVPLAVGIVGMLMGGRLTDAMAFRFGVRWGRRFPMMVTRFTAASGYLLVLWLTTLPSHSPLQTPWAYVAALSLVAFSTDAGNPASWAFKQDVGGRYVGSVLGWGNMWGNLGAALSPLIYNFILGEQPQADDWNTMFLVCLGAFVVAGLCAFGVDATQPIAPPDEPEDDET